MYKDSMYFSEICFIQIGGREILVYKNSKEKKICQNKNLHITFEFQFCHRHLRDLTFLEEDFID